MTRTASLLALAWLLLMVNQGRGQYAYSGQFASGISDPWGIAFDSSNNIYISNYTPYNNIYTYSSSSSYASATLLESGGTHTGLAVYNNQLYASNYASGGVDIYNASSGAYISSFGRSGSAGTIVSNTSGIVIDSRGYSYVADSGNQRVAIYDNNGNYTGQVANGRGLTPQYAAVDKNGNVFVEAYNNAQYLYVFNSAGALTKTFDGTGTGNSIPFNLPEGIAFDSKGDFFVGDFYNNRVVEFDSNFNFLQSFGSGIIGGASQLNGPDDIAVDSQDNVFVVDGYGRRVVEFSPPASVPEPSSFVLAGLLASAGIGGYLWRRSRRATLEGARSAI